MTLTYLIHACEHPDKPCPWKARWRVANTGHKSTKTGVTFLRLCEEHAPPPDKRNQWNTVPIDFGFTPSPEKPPC